MKLIQIVLAVASLFALLVVSTRQAVHVENDLHHNIKAHLIPGCKWMDGRHTGQCCRWNDDGPLPPRHPLGCEIEDWEQSLTKGGEVVKVRGICCPTWVLDLENNDSIMVDNSLENTEGA